MKKFTLYFSLFIFFTVQLTKAQTIVADTVGAGNNLQFNGNGGNYVDFGTTPFKTLNFPVTFEAWVYLTEYPSSNADIFLTDNGANECGFETFIKPGGNVYFLYGNNNGSSSHDEVGQYSSGSLLLDTWTHIAIVCTTATNTSIYFNGIAQSLNYDNGSAIIDSLVHNTSYIATIGSTGITGGFSGQIDEMRVWNIALSQTDVQNTMCSKVATGTPGLIAYWKADEAGTNTTVNDYSGNGVNGTINGATTKGVSAAPLGNTSVNLYTSSWSSASLSLGSLSGDTLTVNQVSGSPNAVQVYTVNAEPLNTTGLKYIPNSYFGVFAVGGTSTGYNVIYHYTFSDGAVNSYNQSSANLSIRTDATDNTWEPLNGTLSTSSNTISKNYQAAPREFILNEPSLTSGIPQLSATNNQLSIYPNPTGGEINIVSTKTIDDLKVFNLLGQMVYESQPKQMQFTFELNDEGMYFVTVTSDNQVSTSKVIVSR